MTKHRLPQLVVASLLAGCSSESLAPLPPPEEPQIRVVTFNTGTSPGLGHDAPPDDGYTSTQAELSDTWYGNGLAWLQIVDDTRAFFEGADVDIVVFQEIFHSGECEMIPADARAGFVCENHQATDPTVAQRVLGPAFQVACHLGKPDKCAAVNRRIGTFRGCDSDLCLDFLDGAEVMGCGSGSRIGRGIIDLVDGTSLTLVNVHGTSGLEQSDQDCRAQQFAQVFVDLGVGDGEPAANGERNLVMGDLNTDPSINADFDEGAQLWNEHVGAGKRMHFVSDIGAGAPASYGGLFNIDHVVSDVFEGSCFIAGLTDGHPPVSQTIFFDHKPVVCELELVIDAL